MKMDHRHEMKSLIVHNARLMRALDKLHRQVGFLELVAVLPFYTDSRRWKIIWIQLKPNVSIPEKPARRKVAGRKR